MLYLLPYLGPVLLAVAAVLLFQGRDFRLAGGIRLAEGAALAALAVAVLCLLVLLVAGPGTSPRLGIEGASLGARIDAVSAIMMVLVGAIGWVVLRYATTYLDGERGRIGFMARMCLALAAVLLLVQAGTLLQLAIGWIAISLLLRRLLLFYSNRVAARRAARKEFVVARLADAALLAAFVLLVAAHGTDDIRAIRLASIPGVVPGEAIVAAWLLALAALLKSAQFPFHGWLTEVMETPTPVSALLHAGIINAGGFVVIRLADVMLLAPGSLALLVMIGGFTAVLGGLAMLTQPAVKTSLAWSTVAQMGFMILQCGLALFPLALLHIVAHSLYKAHAFLSSGGAVDRVVRLRRPGPIAIPRARSIALAFLLALAIYAVIAVAFGLDEKSPQAIALGAILIFGVAYLLAQGLADEAPWELTWRTVAYSAGAAVAYFLLQRIAEWSMVGTLPPTPAPGPLEWALLVLALVSFGLVALAQATFPIWSVHPAARPLRVHLGNGLYANAITDRLLGTWIRGPGANDRKGNAA